MLRECKVCGVKMLPEEGVATLCAKCYRESLKSYYMEHIGGESGFYKTMGMLIEEADKLKTRRLRLKRLLEYNQKMTEGYLLFTYGKTYTELFPEMQD